MMFLELPFAYRYIILLVMLPNRIGRTLPAMSVGNGYTSGTVAYYVIVCGLVNYAIMWMQGVRRVHGLQECTKVYHVCR